MSRGRVKNRKKLFLIIGAVVVLAAVVAFTVAHNSQNVTTVQTGKVAKQDVAATVSASGAHSP